MQFSQNHIANYGASFKAKKCFPRSNAKYSALGPNLPRLPNYLDKKYSFLKSGFVTFQYIWQNVIIQKIKKIHQIDPETNASQTDGQTDGRTGLELLGLIVSHIERINTRKRNTINIVQCSKSSKTMLFSKFTLR